MMEKIPTAGMSREAWLAERRKSLGGSDMGAVLGLNPWASPYTVWADKRGLLPDKEETEAMRIGRDLEPYVAERFAELTGKKPRRVNYILRNPDAPYLHANIDFAVQGEKSGLECKTSSALNVRSFQGGQFPASYYAQCVTYLCVTGWERWYLAALIMGREFKVYQMTTLPEDPVPDWCEASVFVPEEELHALKERAAAFWALVERGEPPAVDGAESTSDAIGVIYAESAADAGTVRLYGEADADLGEYLSISERIDALKAEQEKLKPKIQVWMEDAEAGESDTYKVSWKSQTRRTFDTKRFRKENPGVNLDRYMKEIVSRPFKVAKLKKEE